VFNNTKREVSMAIIRGNSQANRLAGTGSADRIQGLAGNDVLLGGSGSDRVYGGAGNDRLIGGSGADLLNGGAGIDTVSYARSRAVSIDLTARTASGGEAEGDTLRSIENVTGSAYGDFISGNSLANRLDGGRGSDVLIGMSGNDKLFGAAGNDILEGGSGNDALIGGAGSDTAYYWREFAPVTVYLESGFAGGAAAGDSFVSVENLVGSIYDDSLAAAAGGSVHGFAGNDTIYSSAGDQVLTGGMGLDTIHLTGIDNGADRVVLNVGQGADTITSFNPTVGLAGGGDRLALDRTDFAALGARIDASEFVNAPGASATAGHAQLLFDTSNSRLYYDADGTGTGAAVHIATIAGMSLLITQDFTFI
jgi:Ca2+-binding RTX toxin-like protein